MINLLDKKILITGGTGTFGKAILKKLLALGCRDISIFSRDELKQFELQEEFNQSAIHLYLGDIRDFDRLTQVMGGTDIVIHAAAMKQVPASEINPMEAIRTNILGTDNIIRASIEHGVDKVISLSTDKASNPTSLYGSTKLCADKLIIAGNFHPNNTRTKLSVVRYGNVLGSRGSIIPFFKQQVLLKSFTVTDVRMTRFWITTDQAVNFVLSRLNTMYGGEIFVPKISSFKIIDVARVISPETPINIIGIRPGEKIHETMINSDDSSFTYDLGDYFTILSPFMRDTEFYLATGTKVPENFSYTSDNNPIWFTAENFRDLLKSINLL